MIFLKNYGNFLINKYRKKTLNWDLCIEWLLDNLHEKFDCQPMTILGLMSEFRNPMEDFVLI